VVARSQSNSSLQIPRLKRENNIKTDLNSVGKYGLDSTGTGNGSDILV
jgi:hypothetical protein